MLTLERTGPKWDHLGQTLSPYHDLIPNCRFSLSHESNLNQSVWNFLVSTSEVICLLGPSFYSKKGDLA